MDLTTHPKIIEINHRLDKVEAFQEYCKVNHASHTAEDAVQKLIAEKHLELINKTIATQESMANSVNSLSISMNSISKFIKDNEKILELIVSIATGFRGLKKVILGTAAIVAALGVITGAGITVWTIFSTPDILEAIMKLKDLG